MTAAAAPARALAADLHRTWARQGAETLAAALRIVSDLTAQELALVVGLVRERVSLAPVVSAAEMTVTGSTQAGKILLGLASDETAILTDVVKETLGLGPRISAVVDLLPRGLETAVDLHKRLLEQIAEQTEAAVDWYKEDKPLMMTDRIGSMARDGIKAFIQAQQTFLDQVSEQVNIATEPGKEPRAPRQDRVRVLAQLARDAVEKYSDAQKELAELAIERVESGLGGKPAPRTSISAAARDGVNRFTTAQKSLLDLALKRVPEPHRETAERRRAPAKKAAAPPRKRAAAPAKKAAVRTARQAGRAAGRAAAAAVETAGE